MTTQPTPSHAPDRVRVRFAPSPTGFLHIGGARTSLFNWLFARHEGGAFILRIEDTDRKRSQQQYVDEILGSLKWLGMDWDEGPFFQSQRLEVYQQRAQELTAKGMVYEADGALLFKVPMEIVEVDDVIHGKIVVDNRLGKDLVIMKSDGLPTYNFACVVDDADMGITHVVRGDDHISNTPKQVALYQALGMRPPKFAHIPMIHSEDRARLSKRTGAKAISEFHAEGYLPEGLFNYLALLGWSPGGNQEIVSKDEMVKRFELRRVNKTAAIFDVDKLNWVNAQHLKRQDPERLVDVIRPSLEAQGLIGPDYPRARLVEIVRLLQSRAQTLRDLEASAVWFFTKTVRYDRKAKAEVLQQDGVLKIFEMLVGRLEGLSAFDHPTVEQACRGVIAELGIQGGALIHPVRVALTGKTVGPGLFELMAVLGKELCVQRLHDAIKKLTRKPAAKRQATTTDSGQTAA